ncbi:diguanylate cyclase (GGDEF) domain-containing protein [Lachnospiraceae bacterium XBB1006]|nr:diguanylate cyclase (GGDEF) domain-containing protein [Lachnospiraceae bacterium XBB1006]
MFDLNRFDDTTRELLNEIEKNRLVEPAGILEKSRKLAEIAEAQEERGLYAYALFSQAYCLYLLNQIEESSMIYTQIIPDLALTEQWELVARSYSVLGIISSGSGNVPMAMDNYLQGLRVCKEHELTAVSVILDCNIGVLYLGFRDIANAIKYFTNAVETAERIRETHGDYEPYLAKFQAATLYLNLTACYVYSGNIVEARKNMRIAMKLEGEQPTASLHMGLVMQEAQISFLADDTDGLERCIAEIDQSMDNFGAVLDAFDDVVEYASFLQKIGRDSEFWNLLTTLEELVKATKSPFLYRRIVELKINHYKAQGESKEYMLATGLYYELSMKMEEERTESYKQSLSVRLRLEEEKQAKEEMETVAANLRVRSEIDALTGLRNRFKIVNLIEESFIQCQEEEKPFAVELLDVDYFKQYNDNYGHQRGDIILKETAEAIHSLERHRGIYTGRYGGDEFLIVYVNRTKDEVRAFMQELKDIMERRHIVHEYSLCNDIVTLSQGAYHGIPKAECNYKQFMEDADKALYKIKKSGRNNFLVTSEEDKE